MPFLTPGIICGAPSCLTSDTCSPAAVARSFPATVCAHEMLRDLLTLTRVLGLARNSPTLALDALVAAGVVAPLVALLSRWERFKTPVPVDASDGPPVHWTIYILELVCDVGSLAKRSAAARRQMRDAGAAPLLRALAVDPGAKASGFLTPLCCFALKHLSAA